MERAQVAKVLVDKDPSLLLPANKDRLLKELEAHECQSVAAASEPVEATLTTSAVATTISNVDLRMGALLCAFSTRSFALGSHYPDAISADGRCESRPSLHASGFSGTRRFFTGRERADAIGGIHAGTSCLEASHQASQRCDGGSTARCARAPVQLGLPMARGGPDWATGLWLASPKTRCRQQAHWRRR